MYEPNKPVGNWSEDDWNLRLFHSIKLGFPENEVKFTAKLGQEFESLQSELTNSPLPHAFIFQGAPDIIMNKTKTVLIAHEGERPSDDSSSDEYGAIEQSFQKHPLKSKGTLPFPEKVGELLAALYFLLLCRILRGIMRQKEIKDVSACTWIPRRQSDWLHTLQVDWLYI